MFIGIEFSRGVAALMVLITHYSYMITNGSGGILNFLWTGVDLFFVISGFVFAKLIYSGKVNLKHFFIRRFFRLFPIYLLTLIIYFMLSTRNSESIHYLINHIFFLHTLTSLEEAFYFNPAFWSLPVEVEFYLFVPLIAYLTKFKNALLKIFFVAIIFKLFLVLNRTPGEVDSYYILSVHLTGILAEFLIGTFLYKFILTPNCYSKDIKFRIIIGGLGVLFISSLASHFVNVGGSLDNHSVLIGGFFNILCALSYAFILFPLSFVNEQNTPKYLKHILIYTGAISYPVYLIHNASPKIFQLMDIHLNGIILFLASLFFTLFVAIVLHNYIEEPLRLYGQRISRKYIYRLSEK
ncbi:hypothetical protein BHECKSOX_289 [Bathymodiolus heckerae thiotrophic gill symbiont]|uniref:acyltransferase family protein n=1 Tax=Bathymodiolus heckerae thiotrophic gill symbiont TaxID=1052212 RepID=UPI0010B0FEEB|nr:acyltransferase [Bathymodiolus heckerae thiotrophic gill symbiont]SHN93461.1 hypothetical protein BHECKSOX_289 [Bathymodiolus heckerae thiotrophic gill symbiont]